MFKRSIAIIAATAAILAFTTASQAADEELTADQLQARLLQRFGDLGIDADNDGTLSREELLTFFGNHKPRLGQQRAMDGTGRRGGPGMHGKRGMRGGPGQGMGPGKGMGQGPGEGRGPGLLIERLEKLDSATVPTDLDARQTERIDTNDDGEVSLEEWKTFAADAKAKLLARLIRVHPDADANGDGELSDKELEALKQQCLARASEQILSNNPDADTDGDGTLSQEELEAFRTTQQDARAARILANHPEADLDSNGQLSQEEIRTFMESRREGRGGRAGFGHKGGKGFGGQRGKACPRQ